VLNAKQRRLFAMKFRQESVHLVLNQYHSANEAILPPDFENGAAPLDQTAIKNNCRDAEKYNHNPRPIKENRTGNPD
jgi:hypothetical protein